MTEYEIHEAYKRYGRNFMTPSVLAVQHFPEEKKTVELSQGEGFKHEPIFGVTFLFYDESGERVFPKPDLSRLIRSKQEAWDAFHLATGQTVKA